MEDNSKMSDRVTYGRFLDNEEYIDFLPGDESLEFESVRYEDHFLQVDHVRGGYNLMTGTDCEHFEPESTASGAAMRCLPGTKLNDDWTDEVWTSSDRLLVNEKTWKSIGNAEQERILQQGWRVFVGRS